MPPKLVQLNYIREIVKLMLSFMYRLASVKRIAFPVLLADYVDIYRKTSFFNLTDEAETQRLKPAWIDCSAKLENVFARHLSRGAPSADLEEAGIQVLWPSLVERIDRGLPLVEYRREASFGCFYYHVTDGVLDLHFTNAVMPDAPFKSLAGRARELYELVRHCGKHHPEATHIKSGTWLNDYPPFRSLFPPNWRDIGEPKSYNSLGWWGQFVNHKGDIHEPHAEQFRAKGTFPHPCTFHQCERATLEAFLERLVTDSVA